MDKPTRLPDPPAAEQRPFSYQAHGVTIEDPWHWLRDPKYPEVDDAAVLDYLKAENAYFEAAMKPHGELRRDAVRGDEGPAQGRRKLGPDPRRRVALLVGVQTRRAIPQLVPAEIRRRARRDAVRRAGRGRGQGLFPPRRARGEPRRRACRGAGRRQWLGAVPAPHPRRRFGPGHRDRDRRRHRPTGVVERQRRHHIHRGQRELA